MLQHSVLEQQQNRMQQQQEMLERMRNRPPQSKPQTAKLPPPPAPEKEITFINFDENSMRPKHEQKQMSGQSKAAAAEQEQPRQRRLQQPQEQDQHHLDTLAVLESLDALDTFETLDALDIDSSFAFPEYIDSPDSMSTFPPRQSNNTRPLPFFFTDEFHALDEEQDPSSSVEHQLSYSHDHSSVSSSSTNSSSKEETAAPSCINANSPAATPPTETLFIAHAFPPTSTGSRQTRAKSKTVMPAQALESLKQELPPKHECDKPVKQQSNAALQHGKYSVSTHKRRASSISSVSSSQPSDSEYEYVYDDDDNYESGSQSEFLSDSESPDIDDTVHRPAKRAKTGRESSNEQAGRVKGAAMAVVAAVGTVAAGIGMSWFLNQ